MGKGMKMNAIGVYLKTLRTEQDKTLDAVAEAVAVSDRIISAWEKGRYDVRIGVMDDLLKALGGSWLDIETIQSRRLSTEQSKAIALRRLRDKPGFTADQRAALEDLTQEQKEALMQVASQMRK